jgi:type IV pilus assembly protein PilO
MAGLPKGQREQGLLLTCVVAIAAIGLYWNFVYTPRSADLDTRRAHLEQLTTLNKKAKSEMAKGSTDEIRQQLAQYQQNLSLIRTLVPAGNEVPSLLEQVSTAARRVGLDVATVDPQPVLTGDTYDTYRYGISVVGGYHQLAEFFTNVGSLNRIVLPVNVTLTSSTNANAQKNHGAPDRAVIEAKFQIQTFVTHDPAADDHDVPPNGKGAKS